MLTQYLIKRWREYFNIIVTKNHDVTPAASNPPVIALAQGFGIVYAYYLVRNVPQDSLEVFGDQLELVRGDATDNDGNHFAGNFKQAFQRGDREPSRTRRYLTASLPVATAAIVCNLCKSSVPSFGLMKLLEPRTRPL